MGVGGGEGVWEEGKCVWEEGKCVWEEGTCGFVYTYTVSVFSVIMNIIALHASLHHNDVTLKWPIDQLLTFVW